MHVTLFVDLLGDKLVRAGQPDPALQRAQHAVPRGVPVPSSGIERARALRRPAGLTGDRIQGEIVLHDAARCGRPGSGRRWPADGSFVGLAALDVAQRGPAENRSRTAATLPPSTHEVAVKLGRRRILGQEHEPARSLAVSGDAAP